MTYRRSSFQGRLDGMDIQPIISFLSCTESVLPRPLAAAESKPVSVQRHKSPPLSRPGPAVRLDAVRGK